MDVLHSIGHRSRDTLPIQSLPMPPSPTSVRWLLSSTRISLLTANLSKVYAEIYPVGCTASVAAQPQQDLFRKVHACLIAPRPAHDSPREQSRADSCLSSPSYNIPQLISTTRLFFPQITHPPRHQPIPPASQAHKTAPSWSTTPAAAQTRPPAPCRAPRPGPSRGWC